MLMPSTTRVESRKRRDSTNERSRSPRPSAAVRTLRTSLRGAVTLFRSTRRSAGQRTRIFLRSLGPFPSGLARAFWASFPPESTGPLGSGPLPLRGASGPRFAALFARHCREQGIVAEFAHLSPWTLPDDLLDPASIEIDRAVVYMDLTLGEEETWTRSLTSDTRRMTRKAQQAGVGVRRAESGDGVPQFHPPRQPPMRRRA